MCFPNPNLYFQVHAAKRCSSIILARSFGTASRQLCTYTVSFNSWTRAGCKVGSKCPAIPWYHQGSRQTSTVDQQLTTDHYIQQRQNGTIIASQSQGNVYVSRSYSRPLCASLPTCHRSPGIVVPATIKIFRRKSDLSIYNIYVCLSMSLFLA